MAITNTREFTADVSNREITIYNKDYFEKFINELPDGKYSFIIKKYRNKTSDRQRRYYWGAVVGGLFKLFKKEVPTSQIHDILGYKFLTTRYEHPLTGDLIEKITSTTKLNTKQMEEYLEQCRKYAMEEYNHRIPLPNETTYGY